MKDERQNIEKQREIIKKKDQKKKPVTCKEKKDIDENDEKMAKREKEFEKIQKRANIYYVKKRRKE